MASPRRLDTPYIYTYDSIYRVHNERANEREGKNAMYYNFLSLPHLCYAALCERRKGKRRRRRLTMFVSRTHCLLLFLLLTLKNIYATKLVVVESTQLIYSESERVRKMKLKNGVPWNKNGEQLIRCSLDFQNFPFIMLVIFKTFPTILLNIFA